MARRTIDNREELGTAFIDAAEETIRAQGLAAVTARGLAKQLGVSVGTVYNVHGSMDDLLAQVNARTLARLETEISGIDVETGSVEEVLIEFARRYRLYVEENLNLWAVMFEGQLKLAESVNQPRIDRLFGFLEHALARSVPNVEDRTKSARVLWASVHGILQMAFTGRQRLLKIDDIEDVIRHAIRCHLAGVNK